MSRTPPAPVTAGVLRWAREDAGLGLRELGELAKVDEDRAREWEGGESLPTLGQLRQVADGLRRPVAFFLTPEPPEQHTEQPPDFRARQRDVSRALRRELRRVSERREAYKALAPEGEAHAWRAWRAAPPATPEAARERLGVPVGEIADARDAAAALRLWLDAVEAQGVLVFQMSRVAVDECRGFAQDDEAVPAIVLNGADAPQARSFTLLHELAHLLERSGALCLLDEDREVEQRCNRFAAAVLMPTDAVGKVVGRLDEPQRVEAVVRGFRVSPIAAALRLRDLGLVTQDTVAGVIRQADLAARRAADRATGGGPARHVLQRRKLGERYLGTVLDALARDAITFTDATYYLESSASTVERMERSLVGRAW